jgi:hypothetical protein
MCAIRTDTFSASASACTAHEAEAYPSLIDFSIGDASRTIAVRAGAAAA